MTINDLNYLNSEEGHRDFEKYRVFPNTKLELLVLKLGKENPYFGSLVSLIKWRRQAEGKFSKNEELFFTGLGLEQSTSELIARHLAQRFLKDWMVVDLTCGIGGNAIFLAEQVKKVIAVDLEEDKIWCASHNAKIYGVDSKMQFIVGDANDNIKNADAFFLDPARDREGDTKTRSILNSRPALLEILPKLLAITKNVAIKISPAFDYEELKLLPEEPEVEIISEDNNCKVAMLWFGDLKTAQRRATCFRAGKKFTIVDNEETAQIEGVKKYLYEADKAINKAHLVDEIASQFNLTKIDYHLNYLSGDSLPDPSWPDVFRKFIVEAHEEFSVKKLQKFLKEKGIVKAEIIVKNVKIKPEELRARLKIKEGGPQFIIVFQDSNAKKWFILANRLD
jgi:SAM-dependent methyltransferase